MEYLYNEDTLNSRISEQYKTILNISEQLLVTDETDLHFVHNLNIKQTILNIYLDFKLPSPRCLKLTMSNRYNK